MTDRDESTVESIENQYWRELEHRVAESLARGVNDLDELLEATEGAFPSDVLKLTKRLGTSWSMATGHGPCAWEDRLPHPSPAHGEYYFTRESSRRLAAMAEGRTLCLGTPSVAIEVAAGGGDVRLVDSSPWLEPRFALSKTSVEHVDNLTVEATREIGKFDVAIIDPPWYSPSLLDWLRVASRSVRRDGAIFMPLIPPLTRPGARNDQADLIALGNAIGTVDITAAEVSYESSRFERTAIGRAGGRIARPWRRARVMRVLNNRPVVEADIKPSGNAWIDRRIGDSTISIDASKSRPDLTSDKFYRFDTVSRRDRNVREANVWTSESTGATLRDPQLLLDSIDASKMRPDVANFPLAELLRRLELNL